MRLDSVRSLKLALPTHLEQRFAKKATASATASSVVVASAAARHHRVPSYFLGVSKRSKGDYRLALRLQDHALEKSSLVEEIISKARGEVDVRYVLASTPAEGQRGFSQRAG